MARAPVNVLIFPFRWTAAGACEYAVFRRADDDGSVWQGVAGGVEAGETPDETARRELSEETGIASAIRWIALDSIASVPAAVFGSSHDWGPDIYVVSERSFGAEVAREQEITLSHEHAEYRWLAFEGAAALLRWDSNRTALWELDQRLKRAARP